MFGYVHITVCRPKFSTIIMLISTYGTELKWMKWSEWNDFWFTHFALPIYYVKPSSGTALTLINVMNVAISVQSTAINRTLISITESLLCETSFACTVLLSSTYNGSTRNEILFRIMKAWNEKHVHCEMKRLFISIFFGNF